MEKRILIIDDEPDILITLSIALKSEGYEVHTALTGEEGLKKLAQVRPDLLLLDLRLPGQQGFEVAREIKTKEEYQNIPIIVISGMDDWASKHIAAKSRIVEFLEKPIDLERLKFHIKDILS